MNPNESLVARLKGEARLRPRGNRFEDFTPGLRFTHHWGRTITEADNTLFSTLTLHYNPHYTNLAFAQAHGHRATPVNPLLVFNTVFEAWESQGNPWGLPSQQRGDWAKDLGLPLVQGPEDLKDIDFLFYVGSAMSYDPRGQKIARAFATVAQAAGVKLGLLGAAEGSTGECARRLGNEMLFQQLATALGETLHGVGAVRIVTADPHALNALRHEVPAFAPAGQTTQMVIGATPSTDADILAMSTRLYGTHGLRRVYYSAYSPIPHADLRLPPIAPPLVREHRLYEADWLVRFYGFAAHELTTAAKPNLDLQVDPKMAWALAHRAFFPVDVNVAPARRSCVCPVSGCARSTASARRSRS